MPCWEIPNCSRLAASASALNWNRRPRCPRYHQRHIAMAVLVQCGWIQLTRLSVVLASGAANNWLGPPCSLELDRRILRAARLAPR